jgi:hypothetical protein
MDLTDSDKVAIQTLSYKQVSCLANFGQSSCLI